jgi:hypothetical protein
MITIYLSEGGNTQVYYNRSNIVLYNTVLYGKAITQSALRRVESGMVYNSFYMPILAYGTPATSLTLTECTILQKPIFNTILPKMGINLKSPRAIVFGTSKYGGSELDHLAAVQGFGWIQYLMVTYDARTGQAN